MLKVFRIILKVLKVDVININIIGIIRIIRIVGPVEIAGLEEGIKVVRLIILDSNILVVFSFFLPIRREYGVILRAESRRNLGLKGLLIPLDFLGGGI